jgi:hypothetical protein
MWIDTIQEMQDNNEGMLLFDDNDYFTVLDYLNGLIYTINGVGGTVVDIQHPSSSVLSVPGRDQGLY